MDSVQNIACDDALIAFVMSSQTELVYYEMETICCHLDFIANTFEYQILSNFIFARQSDCNTRLTIANIHHPVMVNRKFNLNFLTIH